jgi:DNA-binding NtrC family response regulator
LPSLRDRKKDIPLLANHFLAKFALKNKSLVKSMDPDFQEQLLKQVWKGNIRELKNVMERAVILADSETLGLSNLPLEMQTTHGALPIGQVGSFELTNVEKSHIQLVLNHTKGNKTETARLLNIGLSTLYRKIEEYGLS